MVAYHRNAPWLKRSGPELAVLDMFMFRQISTITKLLLNEYVALVIAGNTNH